MARIKFLKSCNFGKLEKKGDLIYGKLGDELEVPDRELYSTMVANAVEDGFLELLKTIAKEPEKEKKKK